MVPETDVLQDQAELEVSPFENIKKQIRFNLIASGALPEDTFEGKSCPEKRFELPPKQLKGRWEVQEPEVILIGESEDGNTLTLAPTSATSMLPFSEEGLANGAKVEDGGPCSASRSSEPLLPAVEELSAQPVTGPHTPVGRLLAAALERALSGEDGDPRCFEGRICNSQLLEAIALPASKGESFAAPVVFEGCVDGVPGFEITIPGGFGDGVLGGVEVSGRSEDRVLGDIGSTVLGPGLASSLLERLQDEPVSSATSGIGTPSSGESETELDGGLAVHPALYQLPTTFRISRSPPNLRRASAPAISITRSLLEGEGGRERLLEIEARIASGGAASTSAEGGERVSAPWRPRRPPRPLSATVTRSQSLRVLSDTSSDSGRNSPNPETFGGFDELREASLSPDLPPPTSTAHSYFPFIRSGAASDIGSRPQMEDAHLTLDDISGLIIGGSPPPSPSAFFGVFDGHGGRDAAEYVGQHLLENLLGDTSFPDDVNKALVRSFLATDQAFQRACLDEEVEPSGTTALTALVFGRTLVVANAGDCRAVLCQKGRTVEMSRDQKPGCEQERSRIVAMGGFVEDGYLNGQLGVARAIGNWHMEDFKTTGQLTAEPEVKVRELSNDDEFLILGCDGLWDVISSKTAVDLARKRLQQHNDPARCSQELVEEALKRQTSDNVTVVTVCFQKDPPPRLSTAAPVGVRRSISVDSLRALQEKLDRC